MNYITYKQIDGTITSGFKVKLYDIVTLNIRNTSLDDILRKEINKFPTTVIIKIDNDYNRKELARLEGSFPSDYIKDIINKLEKE